MDKLTTVDVILAMDADRRNRAEVMVRHLPGPERLINAIKVLGACWLSAALFILVPVLHFFLVPTALLVGLFMFYKRFRLHHRLTGGQLICPKCEQGLPIGTNPFNWPNHLTCPHCNSRVLLEPI